MYKRIDQDKLEDLGLSHKSQIGTEKSLQNVYNFSMLQRFRGGQNLKQVDKSKNS